MKKNRQLSNASDLSDDVVYTPSSATHPEHFSDTHEPKHHRDVERESIEMGMTDVIRDDVTTPPTPPEMEPGHAGCRLFRDRNHYVAPCYNDELLQRRFTVKLILYNLLTYIPSVIIIIAIMASHHVDYQIVTNTKQIFIVFGLTLAVAAVYIYFVGLFRKKPMLYVAIGVQVLLNTSLFACGMLLIHACFLHIISHPSSQADEKNETNADEEGRYLEVEDIFTHSPPYMGFLIISLIAAVQGILVLLIAKRKYSVKDYRIPFVIYTSCFSMSAILVTIALNSGFNNHPIAYDLFQVITGCNFASVVLMRTPHFMGRLYDGKVCPLREGEILYALLHYGL